MTTRPHDVAAAVAAAALADGPWDVDEVLARARTAVGRRAFLPPVVAALLAGYDQPPRDRPREVTAFVVATPAFALAAERSSRAGRPMARVLVRFPVGVPTLRLSSRALPEIATVGDLSSWLGLRDEVLHGYADTRSWERSARDPRLRNYTYAWAPSRSGERLLERPRPRLRVLQRRLLDDLVGRIPLHDAAHGFAPGRSVRTFAAPHAGRRVVVRVDLRSFFSSVTAGRVWAVLRQAGYPEQVAYLLTGLTTNAVPYRELHGHGAPAQRQLLRRPHLPQGAPTSPALANLVAARLDRRLAALADRRGFRYTRYADDLAFSTDGGGADRLLAAVAAVVAAEGFVVHPDKVSVQRAGGRQRLAGLVVNERPRVARREIDRLRAVLHDAALHGPEVANRAGVAHFREHLAGRVAWASHGDPVRAARLADLLAAVRWA